MKIIPITDEEFNLNEGDYPFTIEICTEKMTKGDSGKGKEPEPMFVMELLVETGKGRTFKCTDYFPISLRWKLAALCKSINQEGIYKKEEIHESEFNGGRGIASFKYETNQQSGKKYLKPAKYLPTLLQAEVETPFNDDIPFG